MVDENLALASASYEEGVRLYLPLGSSLPRGESEIFVALAQSYLVTCHMLGKRSIEELISSLEHSELGAKPPLQELLHELR